MRTFLKFVGIIGIIFFLWNWWQDDSQEFLASSGSLEQKKIVAFGDSITEGYGVAPEQNYPTLLQEKLVHNDFPNTTVINMGRSGDTTATALVRVKTVLAEHPDIVIVALGGNDGLRQVPLAQTEKNLRAILTELKADNIQIILCGIRFPLLFGGWKYNGDYEDMYKSLAVEFQASLAESILEDVTGDETLTLPDNIHPNAEGYKTVVENIWPALLRVL